MSTKCTYLFGQRSISNSRVKRAWAGVVEGWVTFREVVSETVSSSPPTTFSGWNTSDSDPVGWPYIRCSSSYKPVTMTNVVSVQMALPFPFNISSFSSL
ncbi:unnamed protein product [Microthlaspi erraticum]|uniref:Uncharacterized protein n=1 Tax=Microthlaspi erraticum TaxID=1685480 RepID=A0A6D2JF41_9BRAS|nr:unnamed protein product [Microthlaspi erraticum]